MERSDLPTADTSRTPPHLHQARFAPPYHFSAIQAPFLCLRSAYLDCTDQGLKPRFVKGEPPTDADIADVLQTISRRVIRKLRHLGYLEAGINDAVATGYDPLISEEPEFARTMAAAVT